MPKTRTQVTSEMINTYAEALEMVNKGLEANSLTPEQLDRNGVAYFGAIINEMHRQRNSSSQNLIGMGQYALVFSNLIHNNPFVEFLKPLAEGKNIVASVRAIGQLMKSTYPTLIELYAHHVANAPVVVTDSVDADNVDEPTVEDAPVTVSE